MLQVHDTLYVCVVQGVLEFVYPDTRFHIKHADREYDIFGHGGMLFWFASSVFYFVVSLWNDNLVTHGG